MSLTLKITSRDNPQIKRVRRVRDGREDGSIFLEGLRLVEEAGRSRIGVESVFVTSELLGEMGEDDINAWLRPQKIYEVSESILQSIGDTQTAQGIVVIADRPETGPDRIPTVASSPTPLVVFLHKINNPSNLGAVLRTAEAAGVAGVITSNESADAFSPKALRAAMGSSLRLPMWTGAGLDDVIDWARGQRLRTTAADVSGEKSYTDVDWNIPRLLVFGSEAHGLAEDEIAKIEDLMVIPMEKDVESLNLAVAAGVIMFEARRQNAIR